MNEFLASTYVESVQRLALGIEPIDAARRDRVAGPLDASFDGVPLPPARPLCPFGWSGFDLGNVLRRVDRHNSCLYVIVYRRGLTVPIDLRLVDRTRRFVPRRLRFPVASEQDVLQGEAVGAVVPASRRIRRPLLFPGAAYAISETATALRGRVLRGGVPMRWARVEARLPTGELMGRAHGDDRGEFLLVLGENPVNFGDLVSPLTVEVTAVAPDPVPTPSTPDLPGLDPLWDLPLEAAPQPGLPDTVSSGEDLPTSYTPGRRVTTAVALPLGKVSSDVPPFVIP